VTVAGPSESEEPETRLVGRVTSLEQESLKLDLRDSGETEVRTAAIVRLERSIRPSRKAKTALIAFGVGFATWATVFTIITEGECFDESGCAGALFGYSALLAVPAAAIGAVVAPGEEWADVPMHRSASRDASSSEKGLRLRLAPMVGKRKGLMIVGSF
jgi:hypothetical protein